MELKEIFKKDRIHIRNREDLDFCLHPLEYDFTFLKDSYKYITIIDRTIISLNTRMIKVLINHGITVFNNDCYPAQKLILANDKPAYIYKSDDNLGCEVGYTGKHICFITDDENIDMPLYKAYGHLWTFINDLPRLINVKGSVNA